MLCVGLHCLAEGSQPRQDVQVSSCEQRHVLLCAVAAGKIIIMDVRQAIFEIPAILFRHAALSLRQQHIPLSTGGEF